MPNNENYWIKPGSRRISRRGIIKGAALGSLGLASAAIVGCGDDDEEPSASPEAQSSATPTTATGTPSAPASPTAKRGGTFNTWHAPFQGLDPHVLSAAGGSGILRAAYQTLLRLNPASFLVEPELAQKWEVISPTELVFSLAPGVKFHNKPPTNGRPMTADDVVYSLNRIRSDNPRFLNRSLLDTIDKIEATDNSNVKLTLKQADAGALTNLAGFPMAIMAKEAVDKAGDKFATADTVVGTGAFVLEAFDDTGGRFVRNSEYWKKGLPYLDSIRVNVLGPDAMWGGFLAGQLHETFVPGSESKKVFADRAKDFNLQWAPEPGYILTTPNTKKQPFSDPRVTKALRLLQDHPEAMSAWAEVHFGRGYLSAALPAALVEWDLPESEYAKFLEYKAPKDEAAKEAISLLSAAGFTESNPLKFVQIGSTGLAWMSPYSELLQAQFKRLSNGVVQTEISLHSPADMNTLRPKGEFDFAIKEDTPAMPFEPDAWFRGFWHSLGSRNYGKYSDTQLDGLIDKQRAIFKIDERKSAIKQVLAHIAGNGPYTSWSGWFNPNAAQKSVKDWAPQAFSTRWGFQYEHVWLDT